MNVMITTHKQINFNYLSLKIVNHLLFFNNTLADIKGIKINFGNLNIPYE